jgi:hypothetical protein
MLALGCPATATSVGVSHYAIAVAAYVMLVGAVMIAMRPPTQRVESTLG